MTRLFVVWWITGLLFGATALTGIDHVARMATVIAPETNTVWPWIRLTIAVVLVGALGMALVVHHRENA
jgi:glycerol-3-phosphate acyltransferase PlsY